VLSVFLGSLVSFKSNNHHTDMEKRTCYRKKQENHGHSFGQKEKKTISVRQNGTSTHQDYQLLCLISV